MASKVEKLVKAMEMYNHHFIECGAWPCNYDKKDLKYIKQCPWLYITYDNKLARDESHSIPDAYLVEYWKTRFQEVEERYESLYQNVKEITEKF